MTQNTPKKNELMMGDTKDIIPFLINENRDLQFIFFYNDSTKSIWFVTVYFNFQTGLFTFEPIPLDHSHHFKETISENHIKQEFIALFKSLHLEVIFKKTKADMKEKLGENFNINDFEKFRQALTDLLSTAEQANPQ